MDPLKSCKFDIHDSKITAKCNLGSFDPQTKNLFQNPDFAESVCGPNNPITNISMSGVQLKEKGFVAGLAVECTKVPSQRNPMLATFDKMMCGPNNELEYYHVGHNNQEIQATMYCKNPIQENVVKF